MPAPTAELARNDFRLWEAEMRDMPSAEDEIATEYEDQALANLRLLTEVEHFLRYMDADGNVPDDIFEAVVLNRKTAISEISMPYAVTETEHEVVERVNEAGRLERVIMWLGKTAIEVAESGYQYHFSPEAYQRVDIEVAEGHFVQQTLRPGVAYAFISPRMSAKDAPRNIAKAEHLHADDSLRVSKAITDRENKLIGRRLQSLLVRGIPLPAWVKMLRDPGNLFGRALAPRDADSALSVMELFSQMELPEEMLPEGPVTLVEAVLPYIDDAEARERVERQLERFRGDQEFFARESDRAGREWALFDLELARSIRTKRASGRVQWFLEQNTDAWSGDSLATIKSHQREYGQYAMSTDFAALLARGKQKLIGDQLSVITGNDEAIRNVSEKDRREIRETYETLVAAKAAGVSPEYIHRLERQQYAQLHRQVIYSGGGCPGEVKNAFGKKGLPGVGELDDPFDEPEEKSPEQDSVTGKIRCVKCRENVPKAKVVKKDCWECPRCWHKVDICTGAVLREGLVRGGGTRKELGSTSMWELVVVAQGQKAEFN